MKKLIIIISTLILVGCASDRHQLPPDVTGDLEPINQQQVINYED